MEEKVCKHCGKHFTRNYGGDYCSQECSRAHKIECPVCGRKISVQGYNKHVLNCQRKAGLISDAEFFSRYKLTGKASTPGKEQERRKRISETMKRNPNAGGLRKGSGRGHKCWYESPIAGKVYLRSTYELEYCKYLDRNGIQWKQNTEGFTYEFKGKVHRYFPDFILLNENLYIEIKEIGRAHV